MAFWSLSQCKPKAYVLEKVSCEFQECVSSCYLNPACERNSTGAGLVRHDEVTGSIAITRSNLRAGHKMETIGTYHVDQIIACRLKTCTQRLVG